MDLQAIRYAAMISTLTFEKLIEIYGRYLRKNDSDDGCHGINPEFSGMVRTQ